MAINKAIWLAKLLFRRGELSRDEIADAWAAVDEGGRRMAVSTFYDNRHLLSERFGIRLRSEGGRYRLDLREGREQEFLRRLFESGGDGGEEGWDESPTVGGRRPTGYGYIAALTRAMQRHTCVILSYEPFSKAPYATRFAPYCLRVFRGRCYAVGHSSHHGGVRTFALDRATRIEPTADPFPRALRFSAREYFAHSIGAYGGADTAAEHVVVDADALAAAYLRTLPLHHSQHETPLPPGGPYASRFEMDVSLSADLLHELLYYGAGIRVAAPEALCRQMAEAARTMLQSYGGEGGGNQEEKD